MQKNRGLQESSVGGCRRREVGGPTDLRRCGSACRSPDHTIGARMLRPLLRNTVCTEPGVLWRGGRRMKAWMLLMCLLLASDAATQGSNPPAGPPALPQPDRPAASQAAGVPVFRSSADLVALNVVATDPKKRFVPGLLSDDFAIFEDGVRQDVSFFATGDSPIDLAVLLDTSASMIGKMDIMQRAA